MAENVCEVRTAGGIFRDWLRVEVSQSFTGRDWVRDFRLLTAEPDNRMLRLKPGDPVDIYLAGQPAIIRGLIADGQLSIDANRKAVQIIGCAKTATADNASAIVPGGEFKGYRIDSIANSVLKPHDIKFRVENGPAGWDLPFPKVIVRHGETPFALLKRLCRQRVLWMRAEPNGDIVAGVTAGRSGHQFVVGGPNANVLSARRHLSIPWVDEFVSRSQTKGSDDQFGRSVSEISASAKQSAGQPGLKRIILAEMPLSAKELQLRTDMEVAIQQAGLLRVTLAYAGWLKPDGTLWTLSDRVSVRSDDLFPGKGEADLRLAGVLYSQDAESGTTTTIELVNDAAFGKTGIDATKDNGFFSPTGAAAVPNALV